MSAKNWKCAITLGVLTLVLAAVPTRANAIISDTFTDADGTALIGRQPDINLPGDASGWRFNGDSTVWTPATNCLIQGNAAALSTDVGAMVYLNYGTYTKPTEWTISGDLTINTVTMGPLDNYKPGVGLGFFDYANSWATFGESGFHGLVLRPDGQLTYLNDLAMKQTVAWSGIGGAPFSTSASYALSYSVNTVTGGITDVSLSGSNADFSAIINDTTNVFSFPGHMGGAGMVVNSADAGGTGFVDNATVVAAAKTYTLSNGRRIILDKGIQIAAYGFFREPDSPLNIPRYLDAHYTMVEGHVDPSVLEQLPAGSLFGDRVELGTPSYWYPTYSNQMVSINVEDEPGPASHPGTLPVLLRLDQYRDDFNSYRAMFPDALMYISSGSLDEYTANPSGAGGDEDGLRTYMQGARPDMLMYSNYPEFAFTPAAREWWYRIMGSFRRVGLEGYDGTGSAPIPYGQYMTMLRGSYTAPVPCESYVRLNRFANLAFGFTYLEDWTYARGGDPTVMFKSEGDYDPTEVYHYVAGGTFNGVTYSSANLEVQRLSPALARLVSTDILIICGTNTPQVPIGASTWSAGTANTGNYTDYITGITPLGRPGFPNVYSDVLIGYFEPLLADNSGCTFADGLHFMIVNGAAGNEVTVDAYGTSDPVAVATGSAAAWAEQYHITFDFTGSDFDSLVRLSRYTGLVELVTLTHYGDAQDETYFLDLTLPGGTGDLFAFWDSSNPLPSIPEPGTMLLLATGPLGLLVMAWKRQK